jgi:hypothetical protein
MCELAVDGAQEATSPRQTQSLRSSMTKIGANAR